MLHTHHTCICTQMHTLTGCKTVVGRGEGLQSICMSAEEWSCLKGGVHSEMVGEISRGWVREVVIDSWQFVVCSGLDQQLMKNLRMHFIMFMYFVNQFCCRVLNFYWESKAGNQVEENYNSLPWREQRHKKEFGGFNSQVLVGRAD